MIALIAALSLSAATPTAASSCSYDKATLLALSPDKFDQDLKGGWRPLAEKPECRKIAADLLGDYRRAHWGTLSEQELHTNYWHEGQIRASAGDSKTALPLLLSGITPAAFEDEFDFTDYALGTVAFLDQDLEALKSARSRLAVKPKPVSWDVQQAEFKAKYHMTMAWPPNLSVLDGLIACFDKPYADAYGDACRAKAARK